MAFLTNQFRERDLSILRSLFESRIMTLSHVASLHFEGRYEAAKKGIQKLKAIGIVKERPRRVYAPSILFLTLKGFKVLSAEGILKDYPTIGLPSLEKRAQVSERTLKHELAVMDVKAAFASAIRPSEQFSVAEFSTWPLLSQFNAYQPTSRIPVLVKPDGFIRIHEKEPDGRTSEHTFFLEVDRSTETQETLALRAACYLDHYKQGGLALRNGYPASAFAEFPFRVLFVFKNAERRNNTAERILQNNPPIFTQVWLSTIPEVIANPLGSIWIRPIDYRNVTRGTAFDVERRREVWGYKRQVERENLLSKSVEKKSIFEI
jgi:hypothetical protein